MAFSSHPGERLKEQRKARRWTQDEAASNCGVSREMWGKYERGTAKPGADVLTKMGEAGLDVVYILTGQTPELRERLGQLRDVTSATAMLDEDEAAAIAELQARFFRLLSGEEHEEKTLLQNYRRCTPPDKETIRKLAERLADSGSASAPADAKKRA